MFAVVYLCICLAIVAPVATDEKTVPNFLFVLTDDQDSVLDGFEPIKSLHSISGTYFNNCIVTTPVCCPSRSSILTGLYQHNHKVLNNTLDGNCNGEYWRHHLEPSKTLPVFLKRKNYRTFYAGKYLNQYGKNKNYSVPVGWDWWAGLIGNSRYFNYSLSINGTLKKFQNEYLTDVIRDYALDFLSSSQAEPFFMFLAPPAPHSPFSCAKRHKRMYNDLPLKITPNFNVSWDVLKQKHWLLRMRPDYLPATANVTLTKLNRKRWRTLAAVDEMIESIVKKLKHYGLYKQTYIVFMSDNGYHIGQFNQPYDKRQPYNTDIKVPLFIHYPHKKSERTQRTSNLQVANIDILPTILDIAGVPLYGNESFDGLTFRNEISNLNTISNREYLLIEYYGESYPSTVNTNDCPYLRNEQNEFMECSSANFCKCQDVRNNSYSCLKSRARLHCHFYDMENFSELYDLIADPWQIVNLATQTNTTLESNSLELLNKLKKCTGSMCQFN